MSASDVSAVRVDATPPVAAVAVPQEAVVAPAAVDRPAAGQASLGEGDRVQIRKAAADFNRAFTYFSVQAHFSIHEATKSIVIDLIDSNTGEVIREIPPKELLDRYAEMLDLLGLLVDRRA